VSIIKTISPKRVALLVNKIDKEAAMPLSNILALCQRNEFEPFYSSQQMNCLTVLKNIVIWFQSKKDADTLRSCKGDAINPKFLSTILGFGPLPT
jgi:hypothetical protein